MKLIDTLFSAWKKEDRDGQVIQLQKRFILILCGICILLVLGWMNAPSRLTVYVPPDLSNGATLKSGEIPKPLIYSFAYELWQELNYWPSDGSQDYTKNIQTYRYYLTPEFQTNLLDDFNELKDLGQIQRIRHVIGIEGSAYDSSLVKQLSSDTWEVDLKMRLTEYKNNQAVKDVEILYPLKVTRMDVSQQYNPYGLALAGFLSEPIRLKTYI